MSGWATATATGIATGISAFVATNLDDMVILMLFCSQLNHGFRMRHIVAGQYLGFGVIILASLPGFLGRELISEAWIGLLGFLPILIGIRQLLDNDHGEAQKSEIQTVTLPISAHRSRVASFLVPQTYHVAAVTVANGGDNIGIYLPLFASSNSRELIVILSVFLLMVALWCWLALQLARHPAVAPKLSRYGHRLMPYLLIGLGLFILLENGSYRLLPF